MQKNDVTIQELINHLYKFSISRGWDKHYQPHTLAQAVLQEAQELLAEFPKTAHPRSDSSTTPVYNKDAVTLEIVDVLYYLLMMVKILDIDISQAVEVKLQNLSQRYPQVNK